MIAYIPPNFIPERTYAVSTLLHHYLGIEVIIQPRPGQIHYEFVWDEKSIFIHDQFFGQTIVGQSYLGPNRVPDIGFQAKSPGLEEIIVLFGQDHVDISDQRIVCHTDLMAGAFFMLTRWEETFGIHEDQHGRFPASAATVVKSGHILRPIVDEYVALLRSWFLKLGYTRLYEKSVFRVMPTCDVDMPYYWLRRPRWKVYASEWMKSKSFRRWNMVYQKIKSVKIGNEKDPFDQFEYMMGLAEASGLRFDFNMIAGGISRYEGFYSIRDPMIVQLMNRFVERGHRIGLHPSYNSFHDARQLQEEKAHLEEAIGRRVISSRQHYLKFAVPKTWQLLSEAGIREDSTMGYAAEPGFRCGTSKSFPVFDIYQCTTLPITEHPLLIMDVSLRLYKKYSPSESIKVFDGIRHQVKKHQGEFNFIWHNSNLSAVEGWEEWRSVFEYLLTE